MGTWGQVALHYYPERGQSATFSMDKPAQRALLTLT